MKKQKIEVKIDDLLRHCNWCEECKPKAFDIADYFMKRGRFAKKKIIQKWLEEIRKSFNKNREKKVVVA